MTWGAMPFFTVCRVYTQIIHIINVQFIFGVAVAHVDVQGTSRHHRNDFIVFDSFVRFNVQQPLVLRIEGKIRFCIVSYEIGLKVLLRWREYIASVS